MLGHHLNRQADHRLHDENSPLAHDGRRALTEAGEEFQRQFSGRQLRQLKQFCPAKSADVGKFLEVSTGFSTNALICIGKQFVPGL